MQSYLEKNAFHELMIKEPPSDELKAIIVIPSFNEPDLLDAIRSLQQCNLSNGWIEILTVLNSPLSADALITDLHRLQYESIQKLSKESSLANIRVHSLKPIQLPDKIAGVGLARKIGMDEAVRRFEFLGKDGIIFNFDADCLCSPDYISQVLDYFGNHLEIDAVSIGFHHRWDHLDEQQKQAIILYELHLRCYIGFQKWNSYPFAYQTLGSCFAVRSKAYQAQGGMNKRKAGEDFYFLHKLSIIGKLGELNKILVLPSGRISNRVPFGTGKGVHDIIYSEKLFRTYNPDAISEFCHFMIQARNSYDDFKSGKSFKAKVSSNSLLEFLILHSFEEALDLTLQNCSDSRSFQKRVSKWFDPFRLMKYLHFARESEFPDMEVLEVANLLVKKYHPKEMVFDQSAESLLNMLIAIAYVEK